MLNQHTSSSILPFISAGCSNHCHQSVHPHHQHLVPFCSSVALTVSLSSISQYLIHFLAAAQLLVNQHWHKVPIGIMAGSNSTYLHSLAANIQYPTTCIQYSLKTSLHIGVTITLWSNIQPKWLFISSTSPFNHSHSNSFTLKLYTSFYTTTVYCIFVKNPATISIWIFKLYFLNNCHYSITPFYNVRFFLSIWIIHIASHHIDLNR